MNNETTCQWCHEPIEDDQAIATFDGDPMHTDCAQDARVQAESEERGW